MIIGVMKNRLEIKGGSMENLKITEKLYKRLVKLARENGFSDVDAYAEYKLYELTLNEKEEVISAEDRMKIEERLKALGYLE